MADKYHQLVYCSAASKAFDEAELEALLKQARQNNRRLGVTGLLLYHDGSFVQVLEGERAVIESLYDRIGGDPRHVSISLLLSRSIDAPQFGDWSMGFVGGRELVRSLPGYSDFMRTGASREHQAQAARGILDAFRQGRFRRQIRS